MRSAAFLESLLKIALGIQEGNSSVKFLTNMYVLFYFPLSSPFCLSVLALKILYILMCLYFFFHNKKGYNRLLYSEILPVNVGPSSLRENLELAN